MAGAFDQELRRVYMQILDDLLLAEWFNLVLGQNPKTEFSEHTVTSMQRERVFACRASGKDGFGRGRPISRCSLWSAFAPLLFAIGSWTDALQFLEEVAEVELAGEVHLLVPPWRAASDSRNHKKRNQHRTELQRVQAVNTRCGEAVCRGCSGKELFRSFTSCWLGDLIVCTSDI